MDTQRLSIRGRILQADEPGLQDALAAIYETPERPRCLCVPGGVEMYVAFHHRYMAKRMPDTGSRHHPSCASYEPMPEQSGLGELIGEAVLESAGAVELRVDFAWSRQARGRAAGGRKPEDPGEVKAARRCMSLRALVHFLFERAGFNRWSPAMEGKRTQAVLHKYLMRAAEQVSAKGIVLGERLYVPEPFHESTRLEVAERRRQRLGVLRPVDGVAPLAMVLAEFKAAEACAGGYRVWLKHIPDVPLLASAKTWERIARTYAPVLEARDADLGQRVHAVMAALIRARRDYTYEIDTANLLLASEQWYRSKGSMNCRCCRRWSPLVGASSSRCATTRVMPGCSPMLCCWIPAARRRRCMCSAPSCRHASATPRPRCCGMRPTSGSGRPTGQCRRCPRCTRRGLETAPSRESMNRRDLPAPVSREGGLP